VGLVLFAADGLSTLQALDNSCYQGAALATAMAVIKPLKAVERVANKGLGGNPFKGKTFEEIDQVLTERGFQIPKAGQGSH